MNTKIAMRFIRIRPLVPTDSGEGGLSGWTANFPSHAFDRAGIPIVFIESGEYRVKSVDG